MNEKYQIRKLFICLLNKLLHCKNRNIFDKIIIEDRNANNC